MKYSRCLNLWQVFKLLDPDPYIIYGSGSRIANNIRIRLDPDPQHWFSGLILTLIRIRTYSDSDQDQKGAESELF